MNASRPPRIALLALVFFLCSHLITNPPTVFAQAGAKPELPESAADNRETAASPKSAWGDFTIVEEKEGYPWWGHMLLWFPNRFMDLIDVFRVDVGVGAAFGAAGRLTKYGQFGYRSISPFSVRVGDFGREMPAMVERSSEFGIGPGYFESKDRKICKGEIGLGADLIVGAYVGVCTEEAIDFLTGIFFIDLSDDDIK